MGTFLTYRIAGGEAGMRHFMAQFGPALQWPWTKLVDVPELTDDLLDRLVAQSDAQAAGRSVRELEAERDDCLVAVLQALRSVGVGAGAVVDRYERTLFGLAEPDEHELREMVRQNLRIRAYVDQRFASDTPERAQAAIADWVAGLRRRSEIIETSDPSR